MIKERLDSNGWGYHSLLREETVRLSDRGVIGAKLIMHVMIHDYLLVDGLSAGEGIRENRSVLLKENGE